MDCTEICERTQALTELWGAPLQSNVDLVPAGINFYDQTYESCTLLQVTIATDI
jgi:hypothetical protein